MSLFSFLFPDQVPEEEGYVKGLTAEEIMNLPDMPDEEDEETKGMTIGMFLRTVVLYSYVQF